MNQEKHNSGRKILMLLSNAFNPDPRVHREAVALVKAGYKVKILCWDRDGKSPQHEIIDNINIERIYVRSSHGRGSSQVIFLIFFWIKLFRLGMKDRFNVIHAHDFDTLPLGFALAKIKKAKLIYDSHESYVDMVYTLPAFIRRIIVTTEDFILKRCDLVITVGEILQHHLENRGAHKVCVVGNWQAPEKFSYTQEILAETKQELGIHKYQRVVSFIANLGKERKVPELIEALSGSPEIFLILGGSGPCSDIARNASATFSNIAYLGFVKPDRIPLYTAISDFIFYGFDPGNPNARFSAPNKLFEGLAAGKAIITGDFGEIGNIVKKFNCGLVLPDYTSDNIRKAINGISDEQIRIFSDNAREISKNIFNWSRAEEILLENYSKFQ